MYSYSLQLPLQQPQYTCCIHMYIYYIHIYTTFRRCTTVLFTGCNTTNNRHTHTVRVSSRILSTGDLRKQIYKKNSEITRKLFRFRNSEHFRIRSKKSAIFLVSVLELGVTAVFLVVKKSFRIIPIFRRNESNKRQPLGCINR